MSFRVTDLQFSYPRKPVLRKVDSGDLPGGRLIALLGPNAAGKSTFFRCIAGLLQPQSGAVMLNDQSLHAMPQTQRIRKVCYMPQSFASGAALTVFEVVLLARKHLEDWRVSNDDTAFVEALLQRLGIEHLAGRYIGELSGGQQQMVSICQALVRPAELFLLDEPTSALDLRRQLEVMQILREITAERGAVTIAAMHDLNLAARFADHLMLMRDGEIRASGATSDILASPVLAETYGVKIELRRADDGTHMVGASLGGK